MFTVTATTKHFCSGCVSYQTALQLTIRRWKLPAL